MDRKAFNILALSAWLLFIVAGVCAAPPDNERAAALMRQGQEFFKSCRYEDAQRAYDNAEAVFREINDLSGQAGVFRHRGDIYYRTGDNARALSMYETALSLCLKAHDKAAQAAVFLGMGKVRMRAGENRKALELYEKGLSISRETSDPAGQGGAYRAIGDLYLRKRDFPKALEMYGRALPIYQAGNDPAGLGCVYRGMGETHMRMGDNAGAREFQDKAMGFFRQANDLHGEGDACRSIGDIYYFTVENSRAMEMYNSALPLFIKAGDPAGQAHACTRMGEIYLRTSDYERALEMFSRALPLYQRINDPIGLGDVYFDTGRLNNYKRDFRRALEMYEKALPYYSRAEEPRGMGNVYQGMANVYLRVGDYPGALALCAKALSQYIQANSPLGQANIYWNMGEAHFFLGEYSKALEAYGKALPLYRKVGEPIGQGVVYQDMAEIHFKAGDYQKALRMNEEALAFFLQAGSLVDQIRVYRALGDIYAKTGRNDQCLKMYDAALDISRKAADTDAEAYTLVSKAAVLGRTGKISEAAGLYDEGMARFERVRRQSGFAEMKKHYMEKIYDHYEDAAVFMIANHYVDRAFKYAEAMKARVFLDQLAEGLVNLDKGIDPELKTRRDGIENRLMLVQKQIADESQRRQPDEAKIAALKSEYAGAEEELEAVKRDIHYKNPLYASVQYPEPVLLSDLQNKILKKDEVILEYFLTRDSIYCFVIDKENYQIIKLLAGPEKDGPSPQNQLPATEILKDRVDQFLWEIGIETIWRPHRPMATANLYDILIKPLETHIKGKTVIIVPDGILTRVPFEALTIADEEGPHYFVEKYRTKYVQSASVLAMLRTQYRKEGLSDKFIGFGDPVYDYENFKAGRREKGDTGKKLDRGPGEISRSSYERAGGKMNRLPGSGEEVRQIGRIFAAREKDSNSLLRLEAKEAYARSRQMEEYGYIHFATHGILEDKFQAIALSQIPGDTDDGFLTLGKFMNSRYNAHLVVLSACQTGLGKIDRGEGVTGLTRAVMYAGSPAAVVSLWSVSDDATKDLMIKLYGGLIKGKMTKADALRLAKLDMVRSEKYAHPFFWSAFVMYGE